MFLVNWYLFSFFQWILIIIFNLLCYVQIYIHKQVYYILKTFKIMLIT